MFDELCCSLCLEGSADQIDLDSKDELSIKCAAIIELHFKSQLLMMSLIKMKVVCQKCWQMVQNFNDFYNQVTLAHKEAAAMFKNITVEKEQLANEEECDYDNENPTPHRPHRGRSRQSKAPSKPEYVNDTSNDTNLPLLSPLNECPVQIEDLLKTGSTEDICAEVLLPIAEMKNNCPIADSVSTTLPATGIDSKDTKSKNNKEKADNSDEYIEKKNFKLFCCICHNSLVNFKQLKTHFREEHKSRGYALCCGKKFFERSVLIEHLHFHDDPDYFKCEYCEKVMCERRSLDLHIQYQHGNRERVHRCSICSKGFFRAFTLKQHYKTHVSEDKIPVKCTKCDKTFPDQYELRQHTRDAHINVYAKICDICGLSIMGRSTFERHLAEHSGVQQKLLKCDLCDAALTTKYVLARHMKAMHTEEYRKAHVCPHCPKVSPSLQAHQSHIKYMHNLERKHVCKSCDKGFKRLTGFKEHIATHTGEALYSCSFCPQTFKSNANMYTHRKRKHSKEWAALCELKKSVAIASKELLTFDN